MQALLPFFQSQGYDVEMISTPHRFGQRLAALRRERSWSQAELGRHLNISRGMVAYYESCAKNPTVEFVEKVSEVFNVPIGDLIDRDNISRQKKRGPASRLEQLTEQLLRLPKTKQLIVVQMLEGVL